MFKKIAKFLGFTMVAGVFVLAFGVYWEMSHGETADYQAVKQAISQYGDDLNEMREYLLLPSNDYDFFKASVTDAELENKPAPEGAKDYEKGLKMFTDDLLKTQSLLKKQEEAKQKLGELTGASSFNTGLKKLGLTAEKEFETDETYARAKILSGKTPLAQLLYDLEKKNYSIQSILGMEPVSTNADPELVILDYLDKHKENILSQKEKIETQKTAMKDLVVTPEIAEVLTTNTLNLNPEPVETGTGFEYYVADMNGAPLLTLTLNRDTGKFLMQSVSYDDADKLKPALLEQLKKLNGETKELKAIKQKKVDLDKYLNSTEFKKQLETAGIELMAAREEAGKTLYDLKFKDKEEILATISFDNATGNFSFINGADGEESTLEDILSGSKKKP